jgi:WD40 repeat protein
MMKWLLIFALAINLVGCSGGGDTNTTTTTTTPEVAINYAALTIENIARATATNNFQVSDEMGSISTAVAFSPDSAFVAVGHPNRITIFSLADTTIAPRTINAHEGKVIEVAYSPDGTKLASIGGDKTLKVWDVASGEAILTITSPDDADYIRVVFSPNGEMIASASVVNSYVISVASGEILATFTAGLLVRALAFTPDNSGLWVGAGDKTITLWNIATGETVRQISVANSINDMQLTPDGTRLIVANFTSPGLQIWNAETGEEIATQTVQNTHNQVALNPDATLFIGRWSDTTMDWKWAAYNTTTAERIGVVTLYGGTIQAFAFSPDAKAVATVGSTAGKATLSIWRVAE